MRFLLPITILFVFILTGCGGGGGGGGLTFPSFTPTEAKQPIWITFAGEGIFPSRITPYKTMVQVQPDWFIEEWLIYEPYVHKVEVNYNDGTGWHDYTKQHRRLWKEWPLQDSDAWDDEAGNWAAANGILPEYTITSDGYHYIDARLTWIDGSNDFGESTAQIYINSPDDWNGSWTFNFQSSDDEAEVAWPMWPLNVTISSSSSSDGTVMNVSLDPGFVNITGEGIGWKFFLYLLESQPQWYTTTVGGTGGIRHVNYQMEKVDTNTINMLVSVQTGDVWNDEGNYPYYVTPCYEAIYIGTRN